MNNEHGSHIDDYIKGRLSFKIACVALVLCAFTTVLFPPFLAIYINGYNYPSAWVGAHFAVMARSFMEHGIIALGGVPVQNNSPLTLFPDAYVDWPPLYPMLLAPYFLFLVKARLFIMSLRPLSMLALPFSFLHLLANAQINSLQLWRL